MNNSHSKVIVHALHKTGSTFLLKYFQYLAEELKIPFFSENLGHKQEEFVKINGKGIFSPARLFPNKLNDDVLHIFQIRHPLDILVSEYYSFGYMHAVTNEFQEKRREEIQKLSVDEYCIDQAERLYARFVNIFDIIQYSNRSSYSLVSYSDMVTNFEYWNSAVLSNFDVHEKMERKMYEKFYTEFKPFKALTAEEIIDSKKSRHKRKMFPGDYIEKLATSSINKLEKKFQGIIQIIDVMNNTEVKEKTILKNDPKIGSKMFTNQLYLWNGKNWDVIKSPRIDEIKFAGKNIVYVLEKNGEKDHTVWELNNKRWYKIYKGDVKNIFATDDGYLYGLIWNDTKKIYLAAKWENEKWRNLNGIGTKQIIAAGLIVVVVSEDNKIFKLEDKKWTRLAGSNFEEIYFTEDHILFTKQIINGLTFLSYYDNDKWIRISGSKSVIPINIFSSNSILGKKTIQDNKTGIFNWNGENWQRIPSGDIKGVAMYSNKPIILRDTQNQEGFLFEFSEGKWTRFPNSNFSQVYGGNNDVILCQK